MRRSFISTADVVDILSIQRVLSRVGSYADQKRWEDHRQLFSDEVVIDFGGVKPSQTISSDNLMKRNKASYQGVKTPTHVHKPGCGDYGRYRDSYLNLCNICCS